MKTEITADEYFKDNAVWNGTILMNATKLMEGFAEIKCREMRDKCAGSVERNYNSGYSFRGIIGLIKDTPLPKI